MGLTEALIAATASKNTFAVVNHRRQAAPQLDECLVKKHRVEVKVKKRPESRFFSISQIRKSGWHSIRHGIRHVRIVLDLVKVEVLVHGIAGSGQHAHVGHVFGLGRNAP